MNQQLTQSQHIRTNSVNLLPSEQQLLNRLDSYINKISVDKKKVNLHSRLQLINFWKTSHICVTISQFEAFLSNIEFQISEIDAQLLRRDKVQFVTLEKLLLGVSFWRKQVSTIGQFIKLQGSIQKINKSRFTEANQRQESHVKGNQRSKIKTTRTQKSYSAYSGTYSAMNQQYLAQHKRKLMQNNFMLNQTMIRAKNQGEYQLTIKVGQINDICKKLKNDIVYTINSTKKGIDLVQRNGKSGMESKVTQRQFQRSYNKLKQAFINFSEEIEGTLQNDLRKVLVQVMYASEQLQKQIRLIQSKGITS